MDSFATALNVIRKAKTIVVACHINPDGDALGAMLALGLGLEQKGKRVFYVSPDGIPGHYKNLPGVGRVQKNLPASARRIDLAIAVDCSYPHMLGDAYGIFQRARTVIDMDHHAVREAFGTVSLVDVAAAAMGEVVQPVLEALRVQVTAGIAENLLVSIIVETNSFRLPGIRSQTFSICAKLLKSPVDFSHITNLVYWSRRRESAVLSGIAMARCRFLCRGALAWCQIGLADFHRVGGRAEDVDTVADDLRAIRDVRIAVFFREESSQRLRVSLRSKKGMDVGRVAKIFGGGGHYDVAGCFVKNTSLARRQVLKECQNLLSCRGRAA